MEEKQDQKSVKRAASEESVEDSENPSKKVRESFINFLDLSDEILLVILQNLDSPSLFRLAK